MDKTKQIFLDSAPYKNSYQTSAKRLVFVCSVGMLRSPTAQIVASQMGYNARACGSDVECALIPLTANLINWADKIIFINVDNYLQAMETFKLAGYDEDIKEKSLIWNINDSYDWGDTILFNIIREKLLKLEW